MAFYISPLDTCRLHYADYHPKSSTTITLIFLHGWPMSSLIYSHLFLPLLSQNIRVIALDRRGFGKSEWSGDRHIEVTYDTFASDTVVLMKNLCDEKRGGLGNFVLVGASMGCGESLIVYNKLQGKARSKCKGFIWMGPSLLFPLKTEKNPTAPPRELWDAILTGLRGDRYGFTKAAMPGIFGHGTIEGVNADTVAVQRCIDIITSKDFTQELRETAEDVREGNGELKILVLHGDSDQGMPYEASSKIIKELVHGAEVKVYEKAAHGLYPTHKDQLLKDIPALLGKVNEA